MDTGVAIGIVITAIAAAYAALAVRHSTAARLLFVLAAFVSEYKIWELGVSSSIGLVPRILTVGFAGAFVSVLLVEGWRSAVNGPDSKPSRSPISSPIAPQSPAPMSAPADHSANRDQISHQVDGSEAPIVDHQKMEPSPKVSGSGNSVIDQRVISNNQTGGITARTVNIGVREPNAIYQDGKKVGTVVNGSYTENSNELIFSEIRFTDSVNTARPIELQEALILCDTPKVVSTAADFMNLEQNVRCKIVGKR